VRHAVSAGRLRKACSAVLGNQHGLPPFVVFHPRGPERWLGFQGAVKGGDLAGSVVFHRPLVADVGK